MACEPMKAPAECITSIISLPEATSSCSGVRTAATSSVKVLAWGGAVPVLARGMVAVG